MKAGQRGGRGEPSRNSPEGGAAVAPPADVQQLQAVVAATAEQMPAVGAEVQRRHFALRRQTVDAAGQPEPKQHVGLARTLNTRPREQRNTLVTTGARF